MSRPVRFKRFDRDGVAIDIVSWPLSETGCTSLAPVWAKRLQRGEYSRIELRMEDGSLVIVRKLRSRHAADALPYGAKSPYSVEVCMMATDISAEEQNRLDSRNSR